MQKCERCQTRDARVRFDTVVNGRREQHYFCQPCAEELLGGDLNSFSGMGGGNPFSSFFGNGGAAGPATPFGFRQGSAGTGTAQRTVDKNSKTPTLDQFGRDLTAEARDGKLDPAAGREREIRRVLTVLGR